MAVAGEDSIVFWTAEGTVAPSVGRLSVEGRGLAAKATVKRSVAGLPAPLLRTKATSACGELNWLNEQHFIYSRAISQCVKFHVLFHGLFHTPNS